MGINEIIIYIMAIFMVIGAIDKILGNKFGFGAQFEEGIMAMGSLVLAMVGIICLAPILADILIPIVTPISNLIGNDKSVFAGMILANDMGGYQLAQSLSENKEIAMFSGLILGSMFGPTIVFTLPVALGIIKKEDHP
ncbi:MAG: ethanolamine utilization protein EutH, partial [Erysipelotrichales bacterium]